MSEFALLHSALTALLNREQTNEPDYQTSELSEPSHEQADSAH
jgi:hypothetical protein